MKPTLAIGCEASSVVRFLPDLCPNIESFTFVIYEPGPSLNERLAKRSPDTASVFLKAKAARPLADGMLQYWESLLIAAWSSQHFEAFATEALKHDRHSTREVFLELKASDVAANRIVSEIQKLPKGKAIALDSRCRDRNGELLHLPLMDFQVQAGGDDIGRLMVALRLLDQSNGALLKSGRSYHYYGFDPVKPAGWSAFLYQCLLLSPITDARYISHRLLAGGASLRLNGTPKKPTVPQVVGVLRPA